MSYFGGKQRVAPRIAALLPPHAHYIEPYCGGLSVLLACRPAKMETANDLDGRLMTFWRALRDRPHDLARVCALTPHSRGEYQHCSNVDADPEDEIEVARRVWVRITQGRGGSQRPTGWRSYVDPAGSSVGMPGYLSGYVNRMAAAAARLARVSLESRPALELIEQYGAAEGVLLYVDPPYLGSTRGGQHYLVEMSGEREHVELLGALIRCRAAVVLSGYDSPLYEAHLGHWHQVRFPAKTDSAEVGDRARTEVLWSNRPLGEQHGLWDEDPQ